TQVSGRHELPLRFDGRCHSLCASSKPPTSPLSDELSLTQGAHPIAAYRGAACQEAMHRPSMPLSQLAIRMLLFVTEARELSSASSVLQPASRRVCGGGVADDRDVRGADSAAAADEIGPGLDPALDRARGEPGGAGPGAAAGVPVLAAVRI